MKKAQNMPQMSFTHQKRPLRHLTHQTDYEDVVRGKCGGGGGGGWGKRGGE